MSDTEAWPTTHIDNAVLDEHHVELVWDDRSTRRLPLVWLRDNCPCTDCRYVDTDEHKVLVAHTEVQAAEVRVEADRINLTWADNHVSHFDSLVLANAVNTARRGRWTPTLWDSTARLHRCDHDRLLDDPDLRRESFAAYRDYGAIIVTGMPTMPGQVDIFLTSLGIPVRELPFDRVHDVWVDPAGYNVAHSAVGIPPHSDFPSYAWPPSGQLLHMLVNDCPGGDSIAVDGWRVLHDLRAEAPELFDVLTFEPVGFRQFSASCETYARQPLVRVNSAGEIAGLRFSNQLMQPLDPTGPSVDRFYEAYRTLTAMLLDDRYAQRFRLEAGDMLMTHGHRVLHGRTEFQPVGRRHLQDIYFEFDDVMGQLSRLTGESAPPAERSHS